MKLLRDLLEITRKDLLEFSRDKMRLVTFFIMPMFMMIMVGFIFPNQNALKNAPIGLADLDKSELSKQFVSVIKKMETDDGTKIFKVKDYSSLNAVKEAIKKHEANGGIYIPEDFSKKIAEGKQAEIIIVEDQSNPQASQIFNQILKGVVDRFSTEIAVKKVLIATRAKSSDIARRLVEPVVAKFEGIVKGEFNYFEFVAPGIIAMIVLTAVLTGLAASVAREKEIGTLDGILISPIDRLAIVVGKALAQAVRGLVQGSIVLLLAILLFGVKIHGSLLLILLILLLGVFSFVGFGILVSAAATEQETATQLLFMFQFPMLFLSGVFFPISMMPGFMQAISKVIPLTYAIEALRKVMILGASINAVKTELLILFAFGLVTTSISVPVFKRMITR